MGILMVTVVLQIKVMDDRSYAFDSSILDACPLAKDLEGASIAFVPESDGLIHVKGHGVGCLVWR